MTLQRPRFEDVFRSPEMARDNFLSRLFGLFSEDVVRCWCRHQEAPYEDLGRPTVKLPDERSWGHTLDFTLRDRSTGKTFVAELKCEIAFENYKYIRLTTHDQLTHHQGPAFKKLLALAKDPTAADVRVAGKPMRVDGAILVWGSFEGRGRDAVMTQFGFVDVLSIESMLDNLHAWESTEWQTRVRQLGTWSKELFDYLAIVEERP